MTLDQLSFCTLYFQPSTSNNVRLVGGTPENFVSIGTSLLKGSSLFGCFPLILPEVPMTISMASTTSIPLRDPWILPTPSTIESFGDQILLSLVELVYQDIQFAYEFLSYLEMSHGPMNSSIASPSIYLLETAIPYDKANMEIMYLNEWSSKRAALE